MQLWYDISKTNQNMKTTGEAMKDKIKYYLRLTINSILLAGILLCLMGLYYSVIKAGIPYQDPPLELQIQYAIHMGIGEILLKNGFIITICSGIIRILLWLICKKRQQK